MNHSLTDLGFDYAGIDVEVLERMVELTEKNAEPPLVLSLRLAEVSGSYLEVVTPKGRAILGGELHRGHRHLYLVGSAQVWGAAAHVCKAQWGACGGL